MDKQPDGVEFAAKKSKKDRDVPAAFWAEGERYPLGELTRQDVAELEAEVKRRRRTPEQVLKERMGLMADDPALWQAILKAAMQEMMAADGGEKPVTQEEFDAYASGMDGMVHTLWLRLKRHRPSLTREDAKKILDIANAGEQAKLDKANEPAKTEN